MAEGVDLARDGRHGALLGRGALGHHDDGGEVAQRVALDQGVAHRVDVERLLGDEDHGGAAGDARPEGDVAGVAAHDLAPPSRGGATRRWCGAGRWPRWRSAPRCRSRRSARWRSGRCRWSWARRPRGMPRSCSLSATPRVSSPPMAIRASMPSASSEARHRSTPPSILNGLVRDEPRIVPPRGRVPRMASTSSGRGLALEHAAPAVEEPDELVAEGALALADDGPHDRVQAGAVAATGQHGHPHVLPPRVDRARSGATPYARQPPPSLSAMSVVIAIDAGTTGVRAIAFDRRGAVGGLVVPGVPAALPAAGLGGARRRPRSGTAVQATLGEVARRARPSRWPPSASPTSARPSVVWDRRTGGPCTGPSSGRTGAPRPAATSCATPATSTWCATRPASCSTRTSRRPSSSGSSPRAAWPAHDDLAFGTVDSWLLWNLTGGPADAGAVHATDVSNASRTLLFDIRSRSWSPELCDLFGVPEALLPEVRPSSGRFGVTADHVAGVGAGRPGQRHRRRPAGGAVRPGLLRAGHDQEHLRHRLVRADERGRDVPRAGRRPAHHDRLDHPGGQPRRHGRSGGSARCGRRRDPLRPRGRHLRHRRRRAVAARRPRHHRPGRRDRRRWPPSIPDSEGVVVVPAFTGLGSPWWDPVRPGHDPRHHPGHRAGRTWPGRWWRRWPSRPATWSRP